MSLDDVEKSVSSDRTFDTDLTEPEQIERELLRLADEVANRLRKRSLVARTIGLKLRFADFHTVTRVRTLPKWVDSGSVLYSTSVELYQALALDRPRVRLLGVKAEGLRDVGSAPEQLTFDDAGAGALRPAGRARPGR